MEVNKAIKVLIGWQECCGGWTITLKEKDSEELGEIISLLKSLEAENKKLKKENKALRKDKWELEGINEACRRENEARREMWEELKKIQDKKIDKNPLNRIAILELTKLKNLEQKYLGGGE